MSSTEDNSHLMKHPSSADSKRRGPDCDAGHVTLAILVLAAMVALSGFLLVSRLTRKRESAAEASSPSNDFDLIESVMDRSLSPCQNFYAYVCSKWEKVQPGLTSTLKLIEQRVIRKAQNAMLRKDNHPYQASATGKVMAAVRNCFDVILNKVDNLHEVNRFLADNSILLPPDDGQAVPTPLELLVSLNLRLGIRAVFTLRPAVDLRTNDRMILTFITDTFSLGLFAMKFPSSNTKAATLIKGKTFAKEVSEVNKKFSTWLFQASSIPTSYLTITELAKATPSISETEWLNAINANLPSPISAGTSMYVYASKGLHVLNKFMEEYKDNPRPAANWITVFVHYLFAGASSYPLQKAFNRYGTRCFDYMRELAPHALNVLTTQFFVSTDEVETVKHILTKMNGLYPTLFSWNDAESKAKTTKRLEDVIVILGIPKKLYSPAVMEQEHRFLPFFNGPFVNDLLRAHKERANVELFLYGQGTTGHGTIERDASIFSTFEEFGNAKYVPYLHTVYIPSAIFTSPFVSLDSLVVSYGLMGSSLGHEILHAFSPLWLEKDPSGVKVEWMTNKTFEDYHARLDCLIDQYNDPNVPGEGNYSVLTLDENYADVAGLELVRAAMQSDPCMELGAPSPIHGLTNKQLFYVAYCFKFCAVHDLAYGYYGGGYASFSDRCNKVLGNFRDFWETFQCQVPSRKRCVQLS